MAELQLFIHPKHKVAKAAERFFKERNLKYHAVDVSRKPPSPGELRRFVQRFGIDAMIDKEAKAYVEGGWQYLQAGEEDWIERLCKDPSVIRLPLVRFGNTLAVGKDEAAWKEIVCTIKAS